LLGYLLPGTITMGYSEWSPLRNHLRAEAIIALVLTAVSLSLWLWAVVGVFRSANRHTSRGGKPIWANVARVLMGISVIGMGFSLHNRTIPELRLMTALVAGHDPLGVVDVDTSADGQTINVDGIVGLGSLDRFKEVFNGSPAAKLVLLNSDGGRETEARSIAKLIQEKHLDTSVEGQCLSACTLIFLGGAKRELSDDAQLGFHQFSTDGASDFEQRATLQEMRESYRSFGIREWFIDHIAATPPDGMWYPTRDELKNAGVFK
jgi:hypothetical protein